MIAEYLAAGDAGDEATLRELVEEQILTHTPGGGVVRGVADLLQTWAAARRGLAELRHEVVAEVRSGDVVAVRVRVSGVHDGPFLGVAATGQRVVVDQALFARVAGGRIAEMWEIVDTGSGLRQLGVLPAGQPLGPTAEPNVEDPKEST